MKISIVSVRDTGGTGWNLAHAINNQCRGQHQAVDITAQKSFINYPVMVHMGDFKLAQLRDFIYQSDVVVFLGHFKPSIEGLKLQVSKLKDAKKLLLFMGSEWRYGKRELMQQAEKMFKKNYDIAVGGPGMFNYKGGVGEDGHQIEPSPEWIKYLPFTRSFKEIAEKYSPCNQDREALDAFGVEKERVVFVHAPTHEIRKGSSTFYKAVTQVMQMVPNMIFSSVRGQPWVNCLRALSAADVLLDQDPPYPEAYGAISIEASIFKLPVVTRIDPDAIDVLCKMTGRKPPFVQWANDDDLRERIYHLATRPDLRRELGEAAYEFGKAVHDEKPVVDRFMKIVDGIV